MDAIVAAHESLEMPASLISQEGAMRQQMFQQLGGPYHKIWISLSILPDEMFSER